MKVNIGEVGGITGLITGSGSYVLGAVILVIAIAAIFFWKVKKEE